MIMVDTNSLWYLAERSPESIAFFHAHRPLIVVPWVVLLELQRQVTLNEIAPTAYTAAMSFKVYYPGNMRQFTLNAQEYLREIDSPKEPTLKFADLMVLRSAIEFPADLCTNDLQLVRAAELAGVNVHRCDWVV